MAKESELKVSNPKNFKLSKGRNGKHGMKELKLLKAVLEELLEKQAKLKAKLNNYGEEGKQTMDQVRQVNHLVASFNARIQIYMETKLADPAWDAANQGN